MNIFDTVLIRPMMNLLVILTNILGGNFGVAVIVLTIAIRLATMPLTLKQLHATKAMQSLSPKLKQLQKLYKDDKQKLQAETMKLYKDGGMNPLGCVLPMIIQIPIWIALYNSIVKALGASPEDLLGLSRYLYSGSIVHQSLPLNDHFLWLRLSATDPLYILPVLVGLSMWVQQKMTMQVGPDADPTQSQTNTMMLWMMPIMFAYLTLQFPAGLAVYWVAFNILGIVIQYFVTGWGGLATVPGFKQLAARTKPDAGPRVLPATVKKSPTEKKVKRGQKLPGDKR
ncbi:MAG: YidC/Oxa1 family membrane protein insertase [Dehalococcoidia bacterium]|nr:YidC/Oxa1 family membrane protein insertase [Dehalococcoidia bacterium]